MTNISRQFSSLINWQILVEDLKFLVEQSFSDKILPLSDCISSSTSDKLDDQLKVITDLENDIKSNDNLTDIEARAYALGYAHAISVNQLPNSYYNSLMNLGQSKPNDYELAESSRPVAVIHPIIHYVSTMEWKLTALAGLPTFIQKTVVENTEEPFSFHGYKIDIFERNVPQEKPEHVLLSDPRIL